MPVDPAFSARVETLTDAELRREERRQIELAGPNRGVDAVLQYGSWVVFALAAATPVYFGLTGLVSGDGFIEVMYPVVLLAALSGFFGGAVWLRTFTVRTEAKGRLHELSRERARRSGARADGHAAASASAGA